MPEGNASRLPPDLLVGVGDELIATSGRTYTTQQEYGDITVRGGAAGAGVLRRCHGARQGTQLSNLRATSSALPGSPSCRGGHGARQRAGQRLQDSDGRHRQPPSAAPRHARVPALRVIADPASIGMGIFVITCQNFSVPAALQSKNARAAAGPASVSQTAGQPAAAAAARPLLAAARPLLAAAHFVAAVTQQGGVAAEALGVLAADQRVLKHRACQVGALKGRACSAWGGGG